MVGVETRPCQAMARSIRGARDGRAHGAMGLRGNIRSTLHRKGRGVNTYLDKDADLIRSQVSEDLVPPNAKALFLTYAVLLRAKGVTVSPSDVHNAWAAWMLASGQQHGAIVPFSE